MASVIVRWVLGALLVCSAWGDPIPSGATHIAFRGAGTYGGAEFFFGHAWEMGSMGGGGGGANSYDLIPVTSFDDPGNLDPSWYLYLDVRGVDGGTSYVVYAFISDSAGQSLGGVEYAITNDPFYGGSAISGTGAGGLSVIWPNAQPAAWCWAYSDGLYSSQAAADAGLGPVADCASDPSSGGGGGGGTGDCCCPEEIAMIQEVRDAIQAQDVWLDNLEEYLLLVVADVEDTRQMTEEMRDDLEEIQDLLDNPSSSQQSAVSATYTDETGAGIPGVGGFSLPDFGDWSASGPPSWSMPLGDIASYLGFSASNIPFGDAIFRPIFNTIWAAFGAMFALSAFWWVFDLFRRWIV